jgi:putative OPT family oligopeptide transporter
MNYKMIFNTLGKVLKIEALLLLFPIITSLFYQEWNICLYVGLSAVISLGLGFVLTLTIKPTSTSIYAKEGFITVAFSWIAVSLISALPFYLSGEIPSFIDALFETVSGLTTTGATILIYPENLSHGLLFLRSFNHFIGGMGILVFVMAIVPQSNDKTIHVLRAEMPGPVVDKIVPRSKNTAKILYIIYIGMTALLAILLLCGGMNLFDSITHAFATAGTGGFGIKSDSAMSYSSYTQVVIAVFMFFYFGVMDFNLLHAVVGILVVGIIAFLFTTVAANAIAIVGSNPVSGMTLMTLILASVIMVFVGLKGTAGIVAALIMGGVVCTALSMAGGFITDLKIGYWLGSTPATQQGWKFLGTLVSALTVGGVLIILNKTYGFVGENALVAPQANAMAAVIDPLMSGTGAPWWLYATGAVIALILNFCGISALSFALGMFIPFELNIPLVVGGLINWYVGSRSKDAALNKERVEHGTLLASGFIAGGALMGVVSAALKFAGLDLYMSGWNATSAAEWLSIVMYAVLIIYFIMSVLKKKNN